MATTQENLSPAAMSRINQEVKKLMTTKLEGIDIELNDQDITCIFATIDGPADTPYEGGKFKLRLVLGTDFPQAPPKGYFVTKIFHPNVAKDGEICVNTLKRDWKPELDLTHILITIKCLLIVPNAESALNEEAGRQLLEAYDDYAKHARLMTSIHAMPKDAASQQADEKAAAAKKALAKKTTKNLKRL